MFPHDEDENDASEFEVETLRSKAFSLAGNQTRIVKQYQKIKINTTHSMKYRLWQMLLRCGDFAVTFIYQMGF